MASALGDFLRARRRLATVDRAGPWHGERRTPGLRREEVAMLAGVSSDYYTRLEQGRELRPSAQVLQALARALELCPEATEYLYRLAHPQECGRRQLGGDEEISPHMLRFLEGCDHVVAFVVNRRMDYLARNRRAAALYRGMDIADNVLRLIFLCPAAREFYVDWEQEARAFTAHLRAASDAGRDPLVRELVEELSAASDDFRHIWARHDVRVRTKMPIRYRHRDVGEMTLQYETLRVGSAPGQFIVIGQAEPGSPSARAYASLG
ncbi:helix-turn-helix domain-containing protein [Sphaerisporangium rhizosphaerae]|uniref:Helix-turn-helix domain-containing protein n=1 Tax=Sphaerisporangium rhizosphaerae TaxID=2269375 RepID=A0ABW2P5K9_9ACTN